MYAADGDDVIDAGYSAYAEAGNRGSQNCPADNDVVYGGAGNDLVDGGDGDDRIYGGSGDDELRGDLGNSRLYGWAGNDKLLGDKGKNLLDGGGGPIDIDTCDAAGGKKKFVNCERSLD